MQFVIAITEHRLLGFVLAPYIVKREKEKEYLEIHDRVTLQSLKTYEHMLSPEQVQVVRYIENYNNQSLFKLFSKKKKHTPRDFVENIPPELLVQHVKPYIEKQITKCLDLLEFNPMDVYHKVLQNKIYEKDKIDLVLNKCETVFHFDRNAEGIRYNLTIYYNEQEIALTGKAVIILANNPCCLIIDNQLFLIREIDAKKLSPFIDKPFVSIAKISEKKYLESFVKTVISKHKVVVSGIHIHYKSANPRVVLSLEQNLQGKFALVLKFIYEENTIFLANRLSETKVTFNMQHDEASFVCILRNYDFENEHIGKLLTFGLVNREGPFFEPIEKKLNVQNDFGVVTWLNYNREILSKSGYDVAQSKLEKNYYLDQIQLKIEVSEQVNDWFDINAVVQFDSFAIPFVDFKEHIVQGIREYTLPNGKVMILPEEWFESYSDLLKFSNTDGGKLKLKKQYFSILNSRVSQLNTNFRENLKKLLGTSDREAEKVPDDVLASLRQYQVEGYSWMYQLYLNGFGGCLADDMGLGKTLQTLTLLQRVASENLLPDASPVSNQLVQLDLFASPQDSSQKRTTKISLIVVPTSLIHNWVNEKNKFSPSLRMQVYAGQNRGLLDDYLQQSDLIITSYGILRNDAEQFEKVAFHTVILDESQVIKNPGSKTYQAVMLLKCAHRLTLTGTPVENSLSDLWAQFNFLNPGLLGNLNFFQREFQFPIEKKSDQAKRERLQQLIAPFMLRRTKAQVATELPPLSEQIVYCELNEIQQSIYEREKSKARKLVLENIGSMGIGKASLQILQSLMRLRQISNHPALVDENYLAGSGKFDEITRNLEILHSEGHKALVFSSFVKHLDLVAQWLDERNIPYQTLTGETLHREEVVNEFQNNETCSFFLVSLKAGGVGLNLTAAGYVLMLDPWWNPASEKQAINRAHRIGQDKHVMVYRFISRDTLEEKILRLQERKSQLADIFVNENAFKNITKDEILELFE